MASLKNANLTTGDIVEFFVRFFSAIIMTVLAFTVPAFKEVADTYFALSLLSLIVTFFTLFGKISIPGFNKFLYFDYTYDNTKWFGTKIPTILTVGIAAVAGLTTLFVLSNTTYLVTAPFLQIIQPNVLNTSILSGIAGIVENVFFFAVVWESLQLFFSFLMYKTTGNPFTRAAFYVSGAIVPWIFLVYHNTVYGIDQRATSQAVIGFGYEIVFFTAIFRNYAYSHFRHFFNNFAIALGQTSVISILIMISNSLVTLFALAVITTLGSVALLRSKQTFRRILGVGLAIITAILLIFFIGNIGIFT